MKYIIFPVDKLNEVPQSVLDELHLSPRKSVDGSEVIMKVDNYEKLFPSVAMLPELPEGEQPAPTYPYPTYEGDALTTLLDSNVWSTPEENVLADTPSVLSAETPNVLATDSLSTLSLDNTSVLDATTKSSTRKSSRKTVL